MDTTEAPLLANCDQPECPICLGPFTEPKIMFCGHVICRLCLTTWIKARGMEAGCPLCRHPIFVLRFLDLQMDHLAEYVADSLPTDQVLKVTARGKIDLTPETCQGCENLLCSSRSSPHPNCPGTQDALNTDRREAEACDIVKDLSDKMQVMSQWTKDMQGFLKDIVEEFRGLSVSLLQDQALRFLGIFQSQTAEYRTVLLTHQHLLERIRDSRQVVATILMRKPLQDRVQIMMTDLELLYLSYSLGSQDLLASWITEV